MRDRDHRISDGVVRSVAEIEARKAPIAADRSLGLTWSVVERPADP